MCLSLQGITASIGSPADEGLPQLGFSLKVDVARKSASQQINQSVLPEVSQGSRLGENPSDRRVYHGNSCIVEGHKS